MAKRIHVLSIAYMQIYIPEIITGIPDGQTMASVAHSGNETDS